MLSNFRRIPPSLRRCLHTQIPRQSRQTSRLGLTVGASLAVGSYLTWRLTRDQRIALDSANASKLEAPIKTASIDGPSSETPKPAPKRTKKLEDKPATTTEPSSDAETKTEGISEGEETSDSKSEGEGSSGGGGGGGGGAYDPVTGEINWDCPCLGGMAYGPCGPEFREAFSCFIYSEEEPKGINCVDKFRAMQTCFREHPEHYADEIMDDDDEEAPSTPKPETSEGSPENPESTLGAPAPVPAPASESSSSTSGSQS